MQDERKQQTKGSQSISTQKAKRKTKPQQNPTMKVYRRHAQAFSRRVLARRLSPPSHSLIRGTYIRRARDYTARSSHRETSSSSSIDAREIVKIHCFESVYCCTFPCHFHLLFHLLIPSPSIFLKWRQNRPLSAAAIRFRRLHRKIEKSQSQSHREDPNCGGASTLSLSCSSSTLVVVSV